eukprot:TRINITY_DN11193_c0_g1_i1.p2 TRINITY_DN11193_c0_g1~~TRINITY_DN11193_c0_g1_i1.p2  ORF type:complete len:106 (-),score=0.89 TRINITY_DN11193_c0_g1_i1:142-459(-)
MILRGLYILYAQNGPFCGPVKNTPIKSLVKCEKQDVCQVLTYNIGTSMYEFLDFLQFGFQIYSLHPKISGYHFNCFLADDDAEFNDCFRQFCCLRVILSNPICFQ